MKAKSLRGGLLVLVSFGICLSGSAATRICSVYLESYASLQKQLAVGVGAFQAPQLGALSMMISAGLPGAAQMDNNKPLALHVLDLGDGETGMVLEVSPSGAADAYLQALVGAGAALPPPVNGIYKLPNGTAVRVAGNRLFLAPNAKNPVACLAADVDQLPGMPTLPGVLRISLSPAALAPLLEKAGKAIPAAPAGGAPNAEQTRRTMEKAIAFYGQLLGQLDALHLGINIQPEGLFIRSRLAPKAGTDIAAFVASAKPVGAEQLAFIEKDSLVSYASGASVIPEGLKRQFIDFYAQMVALSPLYDATQTNDLAVVMSQSTRKFDAPTALTASLSADGSTLLAQGTMTMPNPAKYLDEQIALLKTPAFQKLTSLSGGMQLSEPTTRDYKGVKAYAWKTVLDEQAMEKTVRAGIPANLPPEQVEALVKSNLATMRLVMKLFGGGYEYAATAKDFVFGMGTPAMLEAAIDRAQAAPAASAEATRIETLLAPSSEPHSLGRFSLSKLVLLMFAAQPELAAAVKDVPAGEGIVFASWLYDGERLTALLVPASEIKTLTAFAQAAQAQAMQKRGITPPPARPPIPANF